MMTKMTPMRIRGYRHLLIEIRNPELEVDLVVGPEAVAEALHVPLEVALRTVLF